MNDVTIIPELARIFREQLGNNDLAITPATTPDDVSGWDSTTTVGIVMAIEEEFQIEFTANELKNMRSVGDFAAVLGRHKSLAPT